MQKQRQVTSSREAALRTASSPKISQVSRPASIATAIPSPAIQRATAIVDPFEALLNDTIEVVIGTAGALDGEREDVIDPLLQRLADGVALIVPRPCGQRRRKPA